MNFKKPSYSEGVMILIMLIVTSGCIGKTKNSNDMNTNPNHVQLENVDPIPVDEYMTIFPFFGKDFDGNLSLVYADLNGPHSKRVNSASAKLYVVISGEADIATEDGKATLRKDHAFFLKAGAWAEMDGRNCRMLIISAPAFDPADEKIY